jgi:hypothetical protein
LTSERVRLRLELSFFETTLWLIVRSMMMSSIGL